MRHRLQWQIFGALSATGLISVLVATVLAVLVRDDPHPLPRFANDVGAYLVSDMPDARSPAFERELRQRARRLHASISVWDRDGRLLARAGRPLPPPGSGPRAHFVAHDARSLHIPLEDGRSLAVAFDRDPGPPFARRFMAGLALLIAVMVIGSHWAARRIARRLERLEHAVRRFGEGELEERAEQRGRDEIARLAEAFNRSSARIAGLVRQQRRMLQSASHELRSPLARLRMAVELVSEVEVDEGTRQRVRAEAGRDIEELDALIGDLLLAGRLSDTELPREFTLVDLAQIVRDEAARAAVGLRVEQVSIEGDARMLTSLVRNLLENARRHGRDPIAVTLSRVGERAVLWVDDEGDGVPEGDRERIFEPFYRRAGHREGKDGGVGLGLSLVRDIVGHHRGSVRYVARDGGGSRFEVELPAARGLTDPRAPSGPA